jgi:nicotinamide-nucleotide amidase
MSAITQLMDMCNRNAWTIATAESITAGGISAALAREPGISTVLRGAVVAYDPQVKVDILGVDPAAVEHVVSAAVAEQMAIGVKRRLESSIGLATTGVAGPTPLDGQAPGTIWCAIAGPDGSLQSVEWHLMGTRMMIQDEAVRKAVDWLNEVLRGIVMDRE